MDQCIPVKDGIPYIPWIYHVFGDCTYGYLDAASVLLGYLSILFWLNAQFPQVIENYRRGSSEGLSIKFLSIWLAGDSTNLIGCLLTNQLPFQKYLGIYFVTIDICLLAQYLYYTKWKKQPKSKKRSHQHHDHESLPSNILSAFQHPSVQTPLLIQTHSIEDELGPYSTSSSPAKWYTLNAQHYDDAILKVPTNQSTSSYSSTNSSSSLSSSKTKAFLAIMFFGLNLTRSSSFVTNNDNMITSFSSSSSSTNMMSEMDSVMIGRIFAWICTCLYLMSRIPQIRKNIKRQSVEGLAPSLFVFAALGNLTYSASILLHPGQTRESLMEAIPYLIGSAGTLTFDAAIFIQFLWYSRKNTHHRHQQIV